MNCRKVLYFFLLFVVIVANDCSLVSRDNQIAVVNDKTITKEDFIKRYADFINLSGMKDNLKTRNDFLNMIIEEQVILDYADRSGFTRRYGMQDSLNSLRDQIYINYYFENYVYPDLQVSDEELREAYRRSKTQIHARHLFSKTLNGANEIKRKLATGHSFKELAKQCFSDPILAENGGDLGWFTFFDMDPSFEKEAFLLPIGGISGPVKTQHGYSIIQVIDKKMDPFVLEDEYKADFKWLNLKVKKVKHASFLQTITDQMLKEFNIEFNSSNLEAIYRNLNEIKLHAENQRNIPELFLKDGPPANAIVLRSSVGDWDLQKTLEKLSELQAHQWRRILSVDDLRKALSGLVVREGIERDIQKRGIPENADVRQSVQLFQNARIVTKLVQNITNNVTIDDSMLTAYYEDHRNEFISQELYRIGELVVSQSALAQRAIEKLKSGERFDMVANGYSSGNNLVHESGHVGWVPTKQLAKVYPMVSQMSVGQIIGPLEINDQYIILSILDKKTPLRLDFEQSKPIIKSIVLPEARKQALCKYVAQLRSNAKITINKNVLENLSINSQRGRS